MERKTSCVGCDVLCVLIVSEAKKKLCIVHTDYTTQFPVRVFETAQSVDFRNCMYSTST